MYKSVSLAAIAALNGDGSEEFDTQRCLQLQEEILSVSHIWICTDLIYLRFRTLQSPIHKSQHGKNLQGQH